MNHRRWKIIDTIILENCKNSNILKNIEKPFSRLNGTMILKIEVFAIFFRFMIPFNFEYCA